MSLIRSFEGFAPPPRYDAEPFITIDIQESANQGSGYTTIDTITLSPIDADPADPLTRNFTTAEALLDPAWYVITWRDADDDTFDSLPIYFPAVGVPDVEDVQRLLGLGDLTASQQSSIEKAIGSAKEWAKKFLRYDYEDVSEEGTETFFEVNEDGTVPTPVEGAEVLSVTVFRSPGDTGEILDTDLYDANEDFIRLRPNNLVVPFEGAVATRTYGKYTKIVVGYDASSVSIPQAIRDGVALAAASFWLRSGRSAKGFQSETIGDYSYSLGQNSGAEQHPMFGEAKALLRSFRRNPQMV